MTRESDGRLLPWIGAERTVRALVLIAIGIVLVSHTHTDWGRVVSNLARDFGLDPSRNGIRRLTAKAHRLPPHKLLLYGIVALAYGALEGTEAYGLLRRRAWGEYLTVVATSLLLIPEVWELLKGATALKVAAFVVNILIVAYLVHRLRRRREEMRES
ncbi:MAG TPA: DUF2127 domain-containing protein [Solirubrobacteraceae bacterium]|jgi:uncharacterized membrane protein (DUF2068 family)|nr:DUF2127 domain-containing protein [Solirubrobacteraceae bacterium]